MKAWFLDEPRKLRCAEIPEPRPKAGEALVRLKACGICGSDVHYYEAGRIGSYVVTGPLILGHECSGEVVEVGPGVTRIAAGDRVAVEPGVPCGRCEWCRGGRYNLCPDVVFLATPPVHGAFRDLIAHRADFLFKLPPELDYEQGAMIEPLAVGVYAASRANLAFGDTVAVLGTGPIGVLTLQAARARGAGRIFAVDISGPRLELARRLGADETINAATTSPVDAIRELTSGVGVDVCFETAGAVATTQLTVQLCRRGGKVILVGLPPADEIPFPIVAAIAKEIDFLTIFRYANIFPKAISLVASGRVRLEELVTRRFRFGDIREAFEFAAAKSPTTMKVMVNWE